MTDEAAQRADDFPAYKADPLAETLKAIDGIAASADYAADYGRSAVTWCMAAEWTSRPPSGLSRTWESICAKPNDPWKDRTNRHNILHPATARFR